MGRGTEALGLFSGQSGMHSRRYSHIQGAREINKLLQKMEKTEIAKMSRAATRQAARDIILPSYKANAVGMVKGSFDESSFGLSDLQESMGSLIAKSLVVKSMTNMRKGNFGTRVELPDTDQFVYYTNDLYRHFIPAAIEYGHAFPGRGRGKNAPKDVPANPFAATTYEQNRERGIRYLLHTIQNKLQEYVRRNEVKPRGL